MNSFARRAVPALTCLVVLALSAPAGAVTRSFDGSCSFEGPIVPKPGITVIPSADPRFDLHAKGTCAGTLGGVPAPALPLVVEFVNATTPFDTCELGLDIGIRGTMQFRPASGEVLSTPITINMVRAALVAPFQLNSDQGGTGTGVAQFVPDKPIDAVTGCAPGAGITHATLKGSFQTSQPMVATVVPPAAESAAPPLDLRVTVASKALRNVRAQLPISVTTTVRGAAAATLTAGASKLAAGRAAAAGPGTLPLKLTLTKAARRTLARKGRLRARLSVRFTPSTGAARTVSRTVTLRRAA